MTKKEKSDEQSAETRHFGGVSSEIADQYGPPSEWSIDDCRSIAQDFANGSPIIFLFFLLSTIWQTDPLSELNGIGYIDFAFQSQWILILASLLLQDHIVGGFFTHIFNPAIRLLSKGRGFRTPTFFLVQLPMKYFAALVFGAVQAFAVLTVPDLFHGVALFLLWIPFLGYLYATFLLSFEAGVMGGNWRQAIQFLKDTHPFQREDFRRYALRLAGLISLLVAIEIAPSYVTGFREFIGSDKLYSSFFSFFFQVSYGYLIFWNSCILSVYTISIRGSAEEWT